VVVGLAQWWWVWLSGGGFGSVNGVGLGLVVLSRLKETKSLVGACGARAG